MQLGDVMKINFKSKKGFTTIDLTIAMIVVLIFVVIMTSISFNVYSSSTEAKRTATALNYAVDIFEHIGVLNFGEVSASYEILEVESLKALEYTDVSSSGVTDKVSGKIGTYNIDLTIEDYKGEGVIKIITLKITYPVSKKNTETIEMQRLKVAEG